MNNNLSIIFLVGKKEPRTGGEKSNQAIHCFLKEKLHRIELFSEDDLPLFVKVFAGRLNLIYFFLSNIYFSFKIFKSNILLLDFYMHPHLIFSQIIKRKRRRWIAIVREVYHKNPRRTLRSTKIFQSWVLRSIDIMVVNSKATLSGYQEGFSNLPKTEIIYPGFDAIEDPPLRKKFHLNKVNKEKLKLLYVGLIRAKKGIHLLLQALGFLDFSNWQLVLAGDYFGDYGYWSLCKKIINDSPYKKDQIEFTGHLDKGALKKLYMKSHIFIFPSLFEPYGQVIFEAASFSMPIVCSNRGALPEIIPEGCALFFDPENPREIAQCIEELYRNPKLIEHLSKNSKKVLENAVSRREMATNVYKIIDGLVAGIITP